MYSCKHLSSILSKIIFVDGNRKKMRRAVHEYNTRFSTWKAVPALFDELTAFQVDINTKAPVCEV